MDYRYHRFRKELLEEDSSFQSGPEPGHKFPDFDLPTVDGHRLTRDDLAGRPALVVLASYT
jgi:hypothetical protein